MQFFCFFLERTVIVSEQYGTPLSEITFGSNIEVLGLVKDVLKALAYLHSKDITHRSLSKKNIFFCNSQWKVFNYGLYYMTGDGMDVLFPIGLVYFILFKCFLTNNFCYILNYL